MLLIGKGRAPKPKKIRKSSTAAAVDTTVEKTLDDTPANSPDNSPAKSPTSILSGPTRQRLSWTQAEDNVVSVSLVIVLCLVLKVDMSCNRHSVLSAAAL